MPERNTGLQQSVGRFNKNRQDMQQMENTLAGVNVLVVEDSPTQAMQLKDALETHKLHVTIASDGVEGLQALHTQTPQVIISDISMPRMDGYEFCRHVKTDERFKKIPVILLTNLSDSMDVIHGIQCGADSFMTKPYDILLLLSSISDTLTNQKMHRLQTQENVEPMEISFGGKKHILNVNQTQITELLLSTYSNAIQKNFELEQAYRKLNLINQEMEKKNLELVRINEQKNQVLGMAAHDLRNPLGVISGYSQLLLEKNSSKLDVDALKMLEHIQQSSSFMLHLINDLLDISIIESGRVTLNLQRVDLKALIEETIELSRGFASKKNIQLQLKCTEKVPEVTCDPDKIEQVINNLIGNALKFSYEGGVIEIGIVPGTKEAIVYVKDNGVGIPAPEKEKLFQPFSKGRSKGTAGEAGTGLGLAIVKKILTAHRGVIWVESELGQGATFFISLPYEPQDVLKEFPVE